MARALSLAAYRVLSWRGAPVTSDLMPERPEGELLWIHVSNNERFPALCDLSQRLLHHRPDLNLLFSVPYEAQQEDWNTPSCATVVSLPPDHPQTARAFLDHWKPDLCLWAGASLEPNLISETSERSIRMLLIGVDEDAISFRRHRWLPDLTRTTLECFDIILANGETAARSIRRSGVAPIKVSVSSDLKISPNPAPWPEDELIETNHSLAGRPVWLAAWSQPKEFISILTAHRHALRLLHRLLLILHVADPSEAGPLRERLQKMDLRCANWDAGDEINDATQVVLSADPENLGLWYRVSPLAFIGSSLHPGAGGRDPMVAVALGSAVLHGPNVRQHAEIYTRLNNAGAARSVRNAEKLGAGVVELLSPDQAAAMALSGWRLITETSHQTDQLIEMIQDRLDGNGTGHART